MKKLFEQGQCFTDKGIADLLELEGFGIVGGVIDMEGSAIIRDRAIRFYDYAQAIEEVRSILWRDPETGELDPDKEWSVDAIEEVAAILEGLGLSPLTTGQ